MSKTKIVLSSVGGLVLLFVLAFGLEWMGIAWEGFFAPKRENVKREVFEETKSYVHGSIQDLAKYYEEYQTTESTQDKEAISVVVKVRFAEFDADHINSTQLRNFLINVRGY